MDEMEAKMPIDLQAVMRGAYQKVEQAFPTASLATVHRLLGNSLD
jgi:hypothetical protein